MMSPVRRCGIWSALTCAAMLGAPPSLVLAQANSNVQQGVLVRPDTVTIGDPFRVSVRIRAPLGSKLTFPVAPDSGAVEGIDPVQVAASTDTAFVEETASWRVAAWDTGQLMIRFADITMEREGVSRRVRIRALSVFVRSVLPADTALHVPKAARALYTFGPPWWWWLLVALAAIAVGTLVWWLWRRRRRRVAIVADPFALAEEEFSRVEALGLVAAGERGRHVALMVEVLREYLARQVEGADASFTTTELLTALRNDPRVPGNRLAALLSEADLVKFARRRLSPEQAAALGTDARSVATAVHEAVEAEAERVRAADTETASQSRAA